MDDWCAIVFIGSIHSLCYLRAGSMCVVAWKEQIVFRVCPICFTLNRLELGDRVRTFFVYFSWTTEPVRSTITQLENKTTVETVEKQCENGNQITNCLLNFLGYCHWLSIFRWENLDLFNFSFVYYRQLLPIVKDQMKKKKGDRPQKIVFYFIYKIVCHSLFIAVTPHV
jgi:hypothetical protein